MVKKNVQKGKTNELCNTRKDSSDKKEWQAVEMRVYYKINKERV